MNVFVVLPALNEEGNLALVLSGCVQASERAGHPLRVVLVDDGSTDGTRMVAQAWAGRMRLDLIVHEVNQGLGTTIHDGLKRAAELAEPEDVIVTMDADNTQPASLIPRMLQAVEAGHDLVIASRFQVGAEVVGLSTFRRWLTIAASYLYRSIFPIPGVRDYTCGFRAYRASLLRKAFSVYNGRFITEPGFTCMAEILVKLRALAPQVFEVPMVLRYDLKKGASKMPVARTVRRSLNLLVRVGLMGWTSGMSRTARNAAFGLLCFLVLTACGFFGNELKEQASSKSPTAQVSTSAQVSSGSPDYSALTATQWLNLSRTLYQQGKYLETIGAAQTALRLKPDFAEAYNNIGAAYAALRVWDAAIQADQLAVQLDPGMQLARNNLAWAIAQKNLEKH
jgi:dolichol-phosphate mannosyltransferase